MPTPKAVAAAVAKAKENLKTRIVELEEAQDALANTPLGQPGWVVVSEAGISLTFDIENGVVANPRPTATERAIRFTERDAWNIAGQVFNGNRTPAQAMHIKDAIAADLADLRGALDLIQQRLAA